MGNKRLGGVIKLGEFFQRFSIGGYGVFTFGIPLLLLGKGEPIVKEINYLFGGGWIDFAAENAAAKVVEQISGGIEQAAASSSRVADHSGRAAEKAKELKINDVDYWIWSGSGLDNYKDSKTFGKPVDVEYVEFEPKEGTVGHIISFGDPELSKKFSDDVAAILKSIKKAEPVKEAK